MATRRQFLRGLLGLGAAALATELNIPKHMAEEVRDELYQDLNKTSVSLIGAETFENRPVWASTSNLAQYWADHAAKAIAKQIDNSIIESIYGADPDSIKKTATLMTREMDARLRRAEVVEGQKIVVDLPHMQNVKITPQYGDRWQGKLNFELAMGVREETNMFGEKKVVVGYIEHPDTEIVDINGSKLV